MKLSCALYPKRSGLPKDWKQVFVRFGRTGLKGLKGLAELIREFLKEDRPKMVKNCFQDRANLIALSIITVLCFIAAGCSSSPERPVSPPSTKKAEVKNPEDIRYKKALKAFNEKNYASAIKIFKELEHDTESPKSVHQSILFYLGRAYFETGDFVSAKKYLLEVTGNLRIENGKYLALALYHLAYTYDQLGEDVNSLATWHDLYLRKEFLNYEIGLMEVPAKLASAYARLGNVDEAHKYYGYAEQQIARLMANKKNGKIPAWASKVFYFMGNVPIEKINYKRLLYDQESLKRAQSYLVKSMETNDKIWSVKANEKLKLIYNSLVKLPNQIYFVDGNDKDLAKLRKEKLQKKVINEILSMVDEFKLVSNPDDLTNNPLLADISKFVKSTEDDLVSQIYAFDSYDKLTTEAKRRQAIFRKGVTVDPNAQLENNTHRLPATLPKRKNRVKTP